MLSLFFAYFFDNYKNIVRAVNNIGTKSGTNKTKGLIVVKPLVKGTLCLMKSGRNESERTSIGMKLPSTNRRYYKLILAIGNIPAHMLNKKWLWLWLELISHSLHATHRNALEDTKPPHPTDNHFQRYHCAKSSHWLQNWNVFKHWKSASGLNSSIVYTNSVRLVSRMHSDLCALQKTSLKTAVKLYAISVLEITYCGICLLSLSCRKNWNIFHHVFLNHAVNEIKSHWQK